MDGRRSFWRVLKSTSWVDSFKTLNLFTDRPFAHSTCANVLSLTSPKLVSHPLTRLVDESRTQVYTFYSVILDVVVEEENPNRFKPEYSIYNARKDYERYTLQVNLDELAQKSNWVILSAHGGYFAAGVFENGVAVAHKTFHAYVVRKKAGKRQSTKDKTGKYAKSVGSAMRRANEAKHALQIEGLVREWKDYFDSADRIFVNLPGPTNRRALFFKGSPVSSSDPRVRQIPFSTRRPTWNHIQEIYERLTQVEVISFREKQDDEAIRTLLETEPVQPS